MHTDFVLITGASSGLGAEFARQLAPSARGLILVARRGDRLAQLAAELARPGLEIHCFAIDLADAAQRERLISEIEAGNHQITLLINNAGLGDHGLFEGSDWRRVEAMIDVNIKALTQLTRALLPRLIATGDAAILNVSSIASFLPLPHMAVYGATKAYVTSLSEALRIELRGTGVRVTALCPGPVDTEFSQIARRADGSHMPAPDAFKVPAEQVVREALAGLRRNRPRVVPGWFVATVMMITTLLPFFIVRLFLQARGRDYRGH